ncbi:protein of unknown function [Thauera humireducens]|nr:protein of unknown function [Thauera humireducens]
MTGRLRGAAQSADQRLAMYIVISKPKRKSQAAGVSHFMMCLLSVLVIVALLSKATQRIMGEFS